jgi:uncharacterized protein (TIGR03437 family)
MKTSLKLAGLKLAGLCGLALAPAATAAPQIRAILNAASYTRQELPNSAIAPGSVFVVFGTELGPAVLQQTGGFPLLATLGGTSVRVTVGDTTVDAVLLYTSASQLAAILPSRTPAGIGLLAVTYQGHTSQSGAFRIQRSAPGILTQNQSGSGPALAQNFNSEADQPRNGLTRAAHPSQVITLWGTGLGAIAGSDSVAPVPQDLNLNLQVLVGGKAAKVRYKGRSGCCAGVDQIVFEVPAGIEGCYVPVVVRVDDTVSNFATLSVASAGDVCSDLNGVAGTDMEKLQSGGAISWGSAYLRMDRTCGDYYYCYNFSTPATYNEVGSGYFARSGLGNLSSQLRLGLPSLGSCLLSPNGIVTGSFGPAPLSVDSGPVLNLSGPKGTKQLTSKNPGQYFLQFSSLVTQAQYLEPGDYILDNGEGGSDVGPFKVTLTIPKPFTSTVQQSPGLMKIAWTGGNPSGYVIIQGSGVMSPIGANVSFVCTERIAAGQFTLPPEVLLSLPADPAGRALPVSVASPVSTIFRARGLDIGQFSYISAMP